MSTRRVSARSPLPLIIIAVLVLVGLGGGAYWYIAQQQAAEAAVTATQVAQTNVAQQAAMAIQQATSEAQTQATATAQALATARAADLERQYQAGVAYQTARDYAQARVAFQAVIAASPGYKDTSALLSQINEEQAEAAYQQGLASHRARQWADAIEQFDLALAIIPNYKDSATKRADALSRLNATPTPTIAPTEAPSPTPDPNASPTAEPSSARAEEAATAAPARTAAFSDPFDVTMNEKWQIVQTGLSVVDGKLVGREGLVIYKPDRDNHVITTRVAGEKFAVIFRFNGTNGYAFFCNEGNCEWRKFGDALPDTCCNTFNRLSSAVLSVALKDARPHNLTIEVRGSDFLASVDGEPLSSIRDSSHITGSAGLWAGKQTAFESFEVELLP
jgi:hypothetical protein